MTLQSAYGLIERLDTIYSHFDELLQRYNGLYKVETVGPTYMVAAGLPSRQKNHADTLARFCFALLELCKNLGESPLPVRIGVSLFRAARLDWHQQCTCVRVGGRQDHTHTHTHFLRIGPSQVCALPIPCLWGTRELDMLRTEHSPIPTHTA